MNLTEIKVKPISELVDIAKDLGLEDVGRLKKQEIIFTSSWNKKEPDYKVQFVENKICNTMTTRTPAGNNVYKKKVK